MVKKLSPADIVFRLIGPPESVGVLLGMHEKSPYFWRRGSDKRDAGDLPSTQVQRRLLAYARANNIPLTPEHLINGAPESEIDQLVAQRQVAAE